MKRHEDKTENPHARVLRLYKKRLISLEFCKDFQSFYHFDEKTYITINQQSYNYTIVCGIRSSRAFCDYVADGDFYPMERLGRNKSRRTGPAGGALFAETIVYGTTFST